MPGMSSALARVVLVILGAISLAIGVRFGYSSYISEETLQRCINGGPCSPGLNGLALQSAYQTARGEGTGGNSLGDIRRGGNDVQLSFRGPICRSACD